MLAWVPSGVLEVSFSRVHPEIPAPQIGHNENWDKVHAHFSQMKGDHRICPAINVREELGITLCMPYTFRLFRDGRMEVDTWWEEGGPTVFSVMPKQQVFQLDDKEDAGRFVGARVALPNSSSLRSPLGIFTLGDIRLNAWIFDSGVSLSGLPDDVTLMISPLPNHQYPPGYRVGQALASPTRAQLGNLNIPIDFDPRRLPPEQEFVQIERGTPVLQYLPLRIPRVSLRAEG
jgi:hypothetical protein